MTPEPPQDEGPADVGDLTDRDPADILRDIGLLLTRTGHSIEVWLTARGL